MTQAGGLGRMLLALADDEFVLGYRNSEWTGIAPILEEDVALSSISQDEIGHARLFYEMAGDSLGMTADALAYGRKPGAYTNCQLVERPRGDWAYTMARQWLYDAADAVRLESLGRSTHAPLAQAVAKVRREEKYHRMHGEAWLDKLAQGSEESRRRLVSALASLWPDMAGFFQPSEGEAELLDAGLLVEGSPAWVTPWAALVQPGLARNGLGSVPALRVPGGSEAGGRTGVHSPEFEELWDQMTSVYRTDPEAVW
jgi:ring-1,2-phenylacetyl-CoA epoxidase subunit PaaC